jgi:hypothetical protein
MKFEPNEILEAWETDQGMMLLNLNEKEFMVIERYDKHKRTWHDSYIERDTEPYEWDMHNPKRWDIVSHGIME